MRTRNLEDEDSIMHRTRLIIGLLASVFAHAAFGQVIELPNIPVEPDMALSDMGAEVT